MPKTAKSMGKEGAASAALFFASENVPEELRQRGQWVTWCFEERGGKPTKVPVDPKTGFNGSSTDPEKWGSFEEAVARAEKDNLPGVGFVFSSEDPYCGVDLDNVLDLETGEITPEAVSIIKALSSYTEISPSGTGLHIIVRGSLPGSNKRKGNVEMYDRGRFFTVTGDLFPGAPTTIEERQQELETLYRETFGSPEDEQAGELPEPVSPPMSDEEVLEKIRGSKQAAKFEQLWSGDASGYGSRSEADQALVSILAFWTQVVEQIAHLWRESGLVRDKLGREDYVRRTIQKALAGKTDFYGVEYDFGEPVLTRDGRGDTVTLYSDEGPSPTASVPSFPVHALSPSLGRFVEEASHAKEAPVDFVALPVLATLATAIGASRRVEISRTYHESPVIWTAVVAPPAAGKSPAEDAALLPVVHQQKSYNHEYALALDEYKEQHQAWQQEANEARRKKRRIPPEPEKPVKKRIRVGDATLEALMLRLVQNPRGLILTRDELAGFFNSLNQYRQRGGADREVWLSLHSGKAPPLDRKSADESHDIDYPAVSMCGGIQPGKLKVLDIGAGDGMVERFLFAWPEATLLPEAEEDISEEAEQSYREIWERLHALEMGQDEFGKPAPRNVPLAPEAHEVWRKYKRLLKEEAYKPGVSEFMQGVYGKMRAYLARFALILALTRTVESGEGVREEVLPEDLESAWELVSYFVGHAHKVYVELQGESRKMLLARALGELLEENKGEWEGSATELFETLKDLGHGASLPKVPDSLTEEVVNVARKSPSLQAEKKRSGRKGRYIRISWAPVGGGSSYGDSVTVSPTAPVRERPSHTLRVGDVGSIGAANTGGPGSGAEGIDEGAA